MLAVTTMAIITMFAATSTASAQPQNFNCCTYTVDVAGIPASCLPFNIDTEWGPSIRQSFPIIGNGIFVFNLPGICPPALTFNWATINGKLGAIVGLGQTGIVNVGNCFYTISVFTDANGCIYIRIR